MQDSFGLPYNKYGAWEYDQWVPYDDMKDPQYERKQDD